MFGISVDLASFQRDLNHVALNQIPFATSRAINKTALDIQATMRTHMHSVFTVRRPSYVDKAVKIKPFATKGSPTAVIAIDPPGERDDILAKFEQGGEKRPLSGERLAVPVEARRGKAGVVTAADRIKALNFKPHGRSGNVFVGDRRTIMIKKQGGRGVILQRIGRGKNARVKVLYSFRPKVRIKPVLQFEQTALRVVTKKFAGNFELAWQEAIATAR